MSTYDIEINYQTGDSFNSERVTNESLGIITTDINKAKENLKRIKEHYVKYKGSSCSTDEGYRLNLLTDDGEREIRPFWIGYFKTLYGAKIVTDKDTDMEFTFE